MLRRWQRLQYCRRGIDNILYKDTLNPSSGPEYYAYEDFYVAIPLFIPDGQVNLTVADSYLVGVNFYALPVGLPQMAFANARLAIA